jgi:hypothetical protein
MLSGGVVAIGSQALDYREAAVGMVGEEDEEGKGGLGVERGGGGALSVYLETYGCQMNVSDSQVRSPPSLTAMRERHTFRD